MSEIPETDKMRQFIRRLHRQYENKTLLRDWCDINVYFEEKITPDQAVLMGQDDPADESYIQIGEWTKIPVEVIEASGTADLTVQNLIRRITLGERNFLISRLDNKARQGEIPSISGDGLRFEDIQNVSSQVRYPDQLILPLHDDLEEMRHNMRQSDDYYFSNREFAILNGEAVNIHWYPPDKDPDVEGNGYLINSDAISVTQKWHGDSPDPQAFDYDPEYDKFSRNRPLMIYFGKEILEDEDEDTPQFREKLDFLFRTVLSEPSIDSGGALQIQL